MIHINRKIISKLQIQFSNKLYKKTFKMLLIKYFDIIEY